MSQNSSSRRWVGHLDGKLTHFVVAAACLFVATPALAQATGSQTVTVAPAGSMPPGVVVRPETSAAEMPARAVARSSGPEPLSERAAAASARANRALATEEGSDFSPEGVKVEIVDNLDVSPTPRPDVAASGVGIAMPNRAKTSAVKPMPTCVAGCY